MPIPRPIRRRVAPADGNGNGESFDGQVGASLDDGHVSDSSISKTGSNMITGNSGGNSYRSWQRFTTVTIPAGATIDVAHASYKARGTGWDGPGVRTNLYMEDADDPLAPTTAADYDSRATTAAFTAWDEYAFPDTTNFYDTPSIVDSIQEIADRGGWASGQSMQILWKNDASDSSRRYQIQSYNANPNDAAKLHVEFTT